MPGDESTYDYRGKFSNNAAGNDTKGGWDQDGIARHESVKQDVINNRATNRERIVRVETEAMKFLEDRHNKMLDEKEKQRAQENANNAAYQARLEKRKKKRAAKDVKDTSKKIKVTFDE